MKRLTVTGFAMLSAILLSISGCASNKVFSLDVPTNDNTSAATLQALKCAVQQAGWNVTFADESSVSAQKSYGMDNVPLTMNLRIQPGSPTKVVMTSHNPRGIAGSTLNEEPIIEALKSCGSPNVQWAPAQ